MLHLLCFFLLLSRPLPAQQRQMQVVGAEQGLSQGMVFDILQSHDGFLWVATKDGLNRYDGYHCKVFSPDPFDLFAIGGSEIRKLYEDSRGWIWLNYPQGIDIYLPQSGRFFHLPKPAIPIFTGKENASSPLSFAETPDGTIWITDEERLWRIGPPDAALQAAEKAGNAYPKLSVEALPLGVGAVSGKACGVFFSRRHGLLAGTTLGLFSIDWTTRAARLTAFSDKPLSIVGEDPAGRLWLRVAPFPTKSLAPDEGSAFKLGVWDGKQSILLNLNLTYSDRIRLDAVGGLWILYEKVLRQWHTDALIAGEKPVLEWTCEAPFTRVREFAYESLRIDRSGIAWLGTNGYGLLKVHLEKPKFTGKLPLLSQRRIYETPDGQLYVSADEEWLYSNARFDQKKANPWYNAALKFIPTVFDSQGNGWGKYLGHLYRMDAKSKAIRAFPMPCHELLATRNGQITGVTEEGLFVLDLRTEQIQLSRFEKPQTGQLSYSQLLYEDVDGAIWIFSFKGLIRAIPSNGGYRFRYYENDPRDRNSLSNDAVLCVVDDLLEPKRYLWVGTRGGGLNQLDKQTGVFKHYKMEQGLPDNVVYGVLAENSGDYLWLSTNKGLCRFHTREETTKNFGAADGLQDNEFNTGSYFKTRNGALIFGGVNGLTAFYPDSLRFNTVVPQTRIVSLTVNNTAFSYRGQASLVLTYRQNVLTFEFAALEFSNPAQNRYRYQLVQRGLLGMSEEGKWIDLGYQNSVQFANLPPGNYIFRVLGSNNDGVWSAAPAELTFTIRPPWWASAWAYTLYFLALGAAVWFFYQGQLRRRLEHQETLRLRDLDAFKNRFFTNITHEFRTPLTVILGTAEQLAPAVAPALQSKIGLIHRNGRNLLRLINQILDLAKLESNALHLNYVQGDVRPYLRYIAESLHSFANAQNVLVRVDCPEMQIEMDYDPERLLQIVYNLLSNAIKFTPSGGKVTLSIACDKPLSRYHSAFLHIQVADNGVGIPVDDLPHIFDRFYQANNLKKANTGGTGIGLALTKELVAAMGGNISVESQLGNGTTFVVRLPITNKAAPADEEMRTSQIVASEMPSSGVAFEPMPGLPSSGEERPLVLLIEDNPDVVEYLTDCLCSSSLGGSSGAPYRLDFAYNGRAGIEKALETVPDLIISDVMMPEKDGFEVCETLKNDERTSHIPLLLLTAKAGVENRIAGLRRGADAYLAKPFHQEELLVTVANLLDVRRNLQARYGHWASGQAQVRQAAPPATNTPDPEDAFLQKVKAVVTEHLPEPRFTVDDLCRALAMSQPQVHRKLTVLTGKNATLFIRSLRLARAKELLLRKEKNVSEVAYAVGFEDPKYFSRVFSEEFGVAPSKI